MLGLFDYNIRNADLEWQIVGLQPLPDGAVAAQLKQRIGVLPRKQGKYAQSFDSDPSYARVRRDGKRWKIFFITSHAGWARALLASPNAFPGRKHGSGAARHRPTVAARHRAAGVHAAVRHLGAQLRLVPRPAADTEPGSERRPQSLMAGQSHPSDSGKRQLNGASLTVSAKYRFGARTGHGDLVAHSFDAESQTATSPQCSGACACGLVGTGAASAGSPRPR
jgi:hypothetical protein